jgi:molybdate transport system ATP-binding protein
MLEISARSRLIDVAGLRVDGVLALAGPSGAGKTTLLRAIAGLARPDGGHVACGGETWLDTERGVDLPPERRRCGFVFQDHALFPHLSASRNVAYGARGGDAHRWLERLGIAHRAQAKPRELSGGERQRVALARALASEPNALLLDEPLASLDPRTRASAARELADVAAETGVPTIVVTHDFAEASLLATEVAVLDQGRIAQRGTPSELASSPASAFVADFTGAIVLSGSARRVASGLTEVALDGGGVVESTDSASGRVAVSVHPWDIAIGPATGSQRNHLEARITSLTRLGNRTRVGLTGGLTAEVTSESAASLRDGEPVEVVWKAAATRLLALGSAPP